MKIQQKNNQLCKPMTISCYICGRQFGTKSFSIHLKICQQKFNLQQAKIDQKNRVNLPKAPQLLSNILTNSYNSQLLKKYNQQAFKIYKYQVLPSCRFCQRTFNYQSLKIHEKGCDKKPTSRFDYINHDEKKVIYEQNLIKPKTLACCICGREFGTKSLKIHYPQCLQKFVNQEYLKHKDLKDRKNPPKMTQDQIKMIQQKQFWSEEQLQIFNKTMNERYRKQSLIQCINCKRKFVSDSIQKHEKNCVLINGDLNPEGNLKRSKSQKIMHFYEKNIKKPKTLMCYICGRQFGLTSLSIHQKSCLNKFKIQQKNKPSRQRKKLPELPSQISKQNYEIQNAEEWSEEKIMKYNQVVYQIYNKKSLNQCYICQRTFFQQSLPKHLVHCENNLQKLKLKKSLSENQKKLVERCDSIKKQKAMSLNNNNEFKKPRVLMCHICGRQFGLTSLGIHLKSCQNKFLTQQQTKQKKQRKKLPQLPNEIKNSQNFDLSKSQEWKTQTIEQYNKIVNKLYNEKSLFKCYLCQRTFFQQALQKHLKHCQNIAQKLSIQKGKQLTKDQKEIVNKFNTQKINKQYPANFIQSKPKTLFCHVCGRQFGLTSLSIHLPQCQQRFLTVQNKKEIKYRKKLPTLVDQINMQQFDIKTASSWDKTKLQIYNKASEKIYQSYSLFKCAYCQRTFFEEQLLKHQKYCQKQTLRTLSKQSKLSDQKKKLLKKCKSAQENNFIENIIESNQKTNKVRTLVCHICGRQYGSSSFQIHLPKCSQKFLILEQKKNLQQRKQLPILPDQFKTNKFNLKTVNQWSLEMIKIYNEKAHNIYKKVSLSTCVYCNRSFFYQQLPKHLKYCKKQHERTIQKQNHLNNKDIISLDRNDNLQQKDCFEQIELINIKENLVMSIVQEQQNQNSLSSITVSPNKQLKVNNFFQNQNLIPSIQFIQSQNLKPLSNRKNNNFQQNQNNTHIIQDFQQFKHSQISPFQTKKFNQQYCQSNFNDNFFHYVKGQKNYIITQQRNLNRTNSNPQPEKIQCCHCKKKIKSELLSRHLQMCKANFKMTGYKKLEVNK